MDNFEKAAAELENAIKTEETHVADPQPQDIGKAIVKGITDAVSSLVKAGKKGEGLSADNDKRGTLTETEEDPAKKPSSSTKGYPDSKGYSSRKADDEHDDDEDEDEHDDDGDDDSDEGGHEVNPFKKKGCKKCDKSHDDDAVVEVTPFLKGIEKSIKKLSDRSVYLEKGMAIFGELLSEMSDPSRDKLAVAMAKGITFLTDKITKLEKSVEQQNSLVKSIAQMPGMPKVAGIAQSLQKSEESTVAPKISDIERDRLFKAASHRKISTAEFNQALKTGDLACLKDVKF